ncbi:hypothetical protein L202_00632 [Cryptococcus amylolentus CBS 6039]|uniref:Uncharacterized protein n=1 Tax=Cryptococcus amylolentus CBS 6039 TaxID=1295533 RepID=A0A1E3I8Q8_9TREE|nr:hypothetical protein L202_00632 [Cryptococcus amylolentus CBS 6039]ODN84755.1 hypothetical protein L202_00632 [Cryptococcus amylolentus CBS 6039]
MGTRGLIGYILRNKQRKAAYNHWDSYPQGQGHWIAQFIAGLSPEQCEEMANRIRRLRQATQWVESEDEGAPVPEDVKKRYLADGGIWQHNFPHGGPQNWFDEFDFKGLSEDEKQSLIEKKKRKAAELLMNDDFDDPLEDLDWDAVLKGVQGAKALQLIQQGRLSHLVDYTGFLQGFDCEWAYFIDFNNQKMEIWAGDYFIGEVTFSTLRDDKNYMKKRNWSDDEDEDY